MSQVRLACGLPFCQNPQKTQTNLSIGLRITAVALGTIATIAGALILFNIPGLSHFGTIPGWAAVALGAFLILVGTSIKCVKEQSSNEGSQSGIGKESQVRKGRTESISTSIDRTGIQTDIHEDTYASRVTEEEPNKLEKDTSPSGPSQGLDSLKNITYQNQVSKGGDNKIGTAIVSPTEKVEKASQQPLKHIDDIVAMPVQIIEHAQKRIRCMQLHVLLDGILSAQEPNYLDYVHTLITCMQKLQNFDQNLIFAVAFYFEDKTVSLDGHEIKFQAFAKLIFCNLIEKYIGGRIPQDGSQKLNLLSVIYNHVPLQAVVEEWVEKAIPLISLDNIANHLSNENTAEAEKKLSEFMDKSAVYEFSTEKGLFMIPYNYTRLARMLEELQRLS